MIQSVTFCFIFYPLRGQEPCLGFLYSGSLLQAATQMSRYEISKRPPYKWAELHFQSPGQRANNSALHPYSHQPLNWDICFLNITQMIFFFDLHLAGLPLHQLNSDWYLLALSLIDFLVRRHWGTREENGKIVMFRCFKQPLRDDSI